MLRPGEVAERLGISANTLRLWSTHFEQYLSPSAQAARTEKGGAAQRRYTDEDLEILTRAKGLLAQSKTYEEAAELLAEPPGDDEKPPTMAIAEAPDQSPALAILSTHLETIEDYMRRGDSHYAQVITEVRGLRCEFTEMNRNLARLVAIEEQKLNAPPSPPPLTIWQRLFPWL